ncbi:hypothetical protein FNF29_04451 [Cafeteria roenbergensis]|uniref:Kinesin-like protein n=1 Tax=Cafeteria roenbergensis TaxID=33653 RepID=A0A5A8CFF5_CAFRO|nr:hypothetical protein FNF29_04451 [Cafeteria roenbergensis]|eukprot:KAA0151528.1 hypothetical protein FNF29_04451 [Cafeteria roenbergensis]
MSRTPSGRARSRQFSFSAGSPASASGAHTARASTPGGRRGDASELEGYTSDDTAKFRDLIKQLHTERRKNKTLSETLAATSTGGSGDVSRLEREKAQLETDHAIAMATMASQVTQLEAQRGQQARAAENAMVRAKSAEEALAEAEDAAQAAQQEAEAAKAAAEAGQAEAEAAAAVAQERAAASEAEAAAATKRAAEAEAAAAEAAASRQAEAEARTAAEAAASAAAEAAAAASARAAAIAEELAALKESSQAAAEKAVADTARLSEAKAAADAAAADRIAALEAALAERTAALEAMTTRQMETSADLETAQEAAEDLEAQLERSAAEGQRLSAELKARTDEVAGLEDRLAAETARAESERERAELAEAEASEVRSRFEAVDSRRRSVEEQLLDAKGAVRVFARVRPALASEKEAEAEAGEASSGAASSRSNSRTKAGRSGSNGSARRTGAAVGLKRTGSASSMSSTGSAGSGISSKAALVAAASAAASAGPLFQFPAAEAAGEERMLRVQQLPGAGVGGYGVASEGKKTDFSFQRVFGPQAGQEDVFNELDGLVNSAVDGKRVCIFAYGQTGAGKTHTMLGQTAPAEAAEGSDVRVTGESGVIPRAVTSVFSRAATLRDHGWTTDVRAEFLEVYLDDVYDLLARAGIGSAPVPKHSKQASSGSDCASAAADAATTTTTTSTTSGAPPAAVRSASGSGSSAGGIARKASRGAAGASSGPAGGTPSPTDALAIRTAQDGTLRVVGQRAMVVESEAAVFELLTAAAAVRSTASTAMNATSSRSHSVFTLRIACSHAESGLSRSGVLNLVDLAGSERILRSGAADDAQLKREATAINKSLTVLGSVLRAMGANDQRRAARPRSASGQGNRRQGSGDPAGSRSGGSGGSSASLSKSSAGRGGEAHVPFRDSTLTRLLQPSLTRGARAAMIVNLNPLHSSASESLCSLRFAEDVAKRCSTSS